MRIALLGLLLAAAPLRADEVPTAGATVLTRLAPDETPARGPRDAPVVVDFFCNLAHSPCAGVERLLRELAERHPDRLRVVYRQAVLPMRDSEAVAQAALEAFAEGRFFAFVEAAGRGPVRARDLDSLAVRAGLDVEQVHAAIASRRHGAALDRDAALHEQLGVDSSGLSWNGEAFAPELTLDAFERAFARADARARARLADGVPPLRLYATLTREAARARAREGPSARLELDKPRVRLRTDGAPARGAADADVSVVVFGDFERPLWHVLTRLSTLFPGHVRIVYKLYPRGSDAGARAGAVAAACAHLQGRFWEMHDVLAAGPADPDRAVELAGLDVARYRADQAAGRCAALVDADLADGRALGVDYGPTLFVNGVRLVGIHGLSDLRLLVEGEIRPGLLEELTGP
jgi:protein-disulfide isomerase